MRWERRKGQEDWEEGAGVRSSGGEHQLFKGDGGLAWGGWAEGIFLGKGRGGGNVTASAPCLFLNGTQRGKRVARRLATGVEDSTARWSGVSQLKLRLMPSPS